MKKAWTKEEEQFLIKNYVEQGQLYCAEKLNRTVNSIERKAHRLNLRIKPPSWTQQEEQFLIDNYTEYGPAYCAQQLDKTHRAVGVKASRLNLKTTIYNKEYSIEEIQFLIDNYANKGPIYCAEKLNRTYASIGTKASRLNLHANTHYNSNIVYLIYFPDLFLYKVGITSNVNRRIKTFGQPCVILKTQECEPIEAAELERKLLKSVTLINTGALNNGNTETFMQLSKEIELFLK